MLPMPPAASVRFQTATSRLGGCGRLASIAVVGGPRFAVGARASEQRAPRDRRQTTAALIGTRTAAGCND